MGKLIVFEGTDGTGKSTQYARACKRLEAQGVRIDELTGEQRRYLTSWAPARAG